MRDPASIPGSGRPPGEKNGNPLQYSSLENPMNRGAWWATVHGGTRSWTQLSNLACTRHNFFLHSSVDGHLLLLLLLLSCFSRVRLYSVRPHRRQPIRLPRPWDSPGKNTGVGCHFLLQCMKVKSESEVPQSCLTLSNPTDCSLPGSSVHGIF